MNDTNPNYTSPNAAQGYYQGPPVMAPPQYTAPPPPQSQPGFLERCLAALCFCWLLDQCCCDPSIFCCCDPSILCCCCDPSILCAF
ncbi:hypothetical protein LOK49_LG02G03176 [Camellia lanceoleosa]|uniref:Uncharacterized protein n=1 Tax=Camellia lanceoleosa TaxID=1840588 RepID=A0ACC0ITF8_9ERIC|nr:hypothetical protein LOK49_LG02G03176 [Camellia lanceoleosa]